MTTQYHIDAVNKISPFTSNLDVLELRTFRGCGFKQSDLRCRNILRCDICSDNLDRQLQRMNITNHIKCLLYHISLPQDQNDKKNIVQHLFQKIKGLFEYVVILDHRYHTSELKWLEWMIDIDFFSFYKLVLLDWSEEDREKSRNIILVWELRREF